MRAFRYLVVSTLVAFAGVSTDARGQTGSSLRPTLPPEPAPSPTVEGGDDPIAAVGLPDETLVDPADSPDAVTTGSTSPAARPLRARNAEVAPLRPVARSRENVRPAQPLTPTGETADQEGEARASYEPLGLRRGSFVTYLTSRSALGYSTNAGNTAAGSGAAYTDNRSEIAVRSDFARHALDFTLRGGLRDYLDSPQKSVPNVEAIVSGRLDLTEVDRLGGTLRYDWQRESSSSAEVGTASGSDIHTLTASVGYERRAGLIGLDLRGAVDRTIYSGDDRDNTAVTGSLRLSLDNGAVFRPFVETSAFARLRDSEVDETGFRRSSAGGEAKVGLAFDHGTVSGEVGAGYAFERFDDAALGDLKGFVADGSLAWQPNPLTTFTLKADTVFEPSRLAGASGSIVRSLDLAAEYALRPNIILNAGAALTYQDYVGVAREVTTFSVRGGAAWKLNREVELGLVATHSIKDSTVSGEDTQETTVEAAITVRR
ncbi:outer membrane beta-barrel protein [Chthonobacter albigriseus]|uniref:outer membrane beta-barrel protein n=1 Tax=Chthonobacter albigriseus TaxID=1683161 RepID=UPI0015EF4B29|nr:outer membrane beta-barrel protein [Chthonobacter albigriseus]